jgi:hypothetical protein
MVNNRLLQHAPILSNDILAIFPENSTATTFFILIFASAHVQGVTGAIDMLL